MNYYSFHIGDYRRDTAHLSLLEHGVYRQLLDMYYLSEEKIPEETEVVYRRLCARTDEEKNAVNTVLAEFFKRDNGWFHARCERDIEQYQVKADRARKNGKLGGRPHKTNEVISGNQEQTNTKANHKPITNNQEPITNKEKDICASAHAEDAEKIETKKKQTVPYQEIIDAYHSTLPTLAQVYKLTDLRKSRIKNLCCDELEEVSHWENYFKSISRSDFLMGRAPPDTRTGRTFAADFDFIINPTNFVKIAEGKYHEKKIQRR